MTEQDILRFLRLRRNNAREAKNHVDKKSSVWYELDGSEHALHETIKWMLARRKERQLMPSASLDLNGIISLTSLGLRLVSSIIERRAGKSLSSMSPEELRITIAAISIRPVDDLIAEGERIAAERKPKADHKPPVELKNTSSTSPSPSKDPYASPTEFDEGAEINGED